MELERTRVWIELEGRSEIVPVLISDVMDKVLTGLTTLRNIRITSRPPHRKKRMDPPTLLTSARTWR